MSHFGFRCFHRVTMSNKIVANLARRFSSGQKLFDSSLISPSRDEDILLKSIKSSKECSDVLHFVEQHHSIMNRTHIIQAFKVIFSVQKSERPSMSNGEVTNSPPFRTLCNSLKTRVRSLEINDTVDVLKTLSYLGVPSSSKLMTILLNMLASRVNELSLQQIVFIDFLIKDFKPTPIVEALKLALPVVFQANLNLKVEKDNVHEACKLLYYATRKKLSLDAVDRLVDVIMSLRQDIDLESALCLIKAICDFESTDISHRPLLHHAFDIVLNNMNDCSFIELDIILSKCYARYSKNNTFFYHEEFVNSVSNFIIKNNCSFEEGLWTLKKLNKWGHVDIPLLDYLAEKAPTELSCLHGQKQILPKQKLVTLIKGFAIADYRPQNWNILEPIIIKLSEDMYREINVSSWVSYIRDLCTLGTWPLSIIEQIFELKNLEFHFKNNNHVLDQLQLLSLYQEVTTLCPEQYKPNFPLKMLETLRDINGKNISEYPLLSSLQKGLGGASYVSSGVYTKLGHFLHHVIILKKGGYPTPLSTNNKSNYMTYVDDLVQYSDEQYPVAVMYLPTSFYCSNNDKLKGNVKLNLNSISALGLTVVPISPTKWNALLEHERIPYLMREINEKFDFNNSEMIIS